VLATALSLAGAQPAFAQGYVHGPQLGANPALTGFTPEVPVSAFSRVASWFDPSRLRMSTTMSVGTSNGFGTQALAVTSFNYQFAAPLRMGVNVGTTMGTGFGSGSEFFLEGLNLTYQPTASMFFHIDYRNIRSPLQYGGYGGYGGYGYYGGYGGFPPSPYGP
jgi:hypothetical protein